MSQMHNQLAFFMKTLIDCGPPADTVRRRIYLKEMGIPYLQAFLLRARHVCNSGNYNSQASCFVRLIIIHLGRLNPTAPMSPNSAQQLNSKLIDPCTPSAPGLVPPQEIVRHEGDLALVDLHTLHGTEQFAPPPFLDGPEQRSHSATCQRTDCSQYQKLIQRHACQQAARSYSDSS